VRLVVGHANPDFDAYAATIAATRLYPGAKAVFLGSQNTNVRQFHNLHEDLFDFVDLKTLDPAEVDGLVMVDTRDPSRIGEIGPIALDPRVDLVVYDHHPRGFGDVTRGEDRSMDVGATTTILVREIRLRGVAITPFDATVMLLGIHEDTGSFTYPTTTAHDADAAAFLLACGADLEVVDRFLSRSLDAEQRDLMEQLSASLEIWDVNGRPVAVGRAFLDTYVDSAGVVTHHLCEDLGHRVVLAVVRMGDRIQVVARSRVAEVDVGAVLAEIGGGGHAQAASAAIRGDDVDAVLRRLRVALERTVRAPLTAGDIASRPVRTVRPGTTMRRAAELMQRWGHGGLPVVDARGAVVGLVTRKDVDKATRHGLAHAPVKGFMARDVITVGPGVGMTELERLLARAGIGRVPVVEGDEMLGIVTRKDVLRAEHGDAYLDRGIPRVRSEASQRFLASVRTVLPAEHREAIERLGRFAQERGLRAHVVGGFVRDMLLGRENLDVDVVVEGDGVAFALAAAEEFGYRVKVHRRFGTAVLVASRTLHLDVTSARTEYYTRPGALPTVERSSLRQDLLRRDFSINAMAACIDPELFGAIADPFAGLKDLERGALRALHSLSFVEDPTRVLRAARFEARFGFRTDPSTEQLAREAIGMGMLDEVGGARLREEILDIIDETSVVAALRRLDEFGALARVLPEGADITRTLAAVEGAVEGFDVLSGVLARVPRRRVALIAALAGTAAGHAECERWLRRLHFGREYAEPALAAVGRGRAVMRALRDRRGMRDSRLYTMLAGLPGETLPFIWGTGDETSKGRIERFVMELAGVRPAVSGRDLIEMGFEPSSAFSAILERALDDRLDSRAVGREDELANLRRLALRAGMVPTPSS